MFLALGFSTLFTFVYGYAAARSKRAEKVLVPLLDILQSVPVLGFLSVTVTAFIALFRGSLLGLEAASIFAIFTGQAWNMTFSFYQSLRSVPRELDEMATLYRLSRWERFTRLELPASVIGLVWNGMMSFGGGWFFLGRQRSHQRAEPPVHAAGHRLLRRGRGRGQGSPARSAGRSSTMIVLILVIDQLFWKPLVTVADRYKLELSAGEERRFWLVDLWRSASLPRYAERARRSPCFERWIDGSRRLTAVPPTTDRGEPSRAGDRRLQCDSHCGDRGPACARRSGLFCPGWVSAKSGTRRCSAWRPARG